MTDRTGWMTRERLQQLLAGDDLSYGGEWDAVCRMALAALQQDDQQEGVRAALEKIAARECERWMEPGDCIKNGNQDDDDHREPCPPCLAKQALAATAPAKVCEVCEGKRWIVGPDADGTPERIPCPSCTPAALSEHREGTK